MGRRFQSPEERYSYRGCQGGLCGGGSHHCHKGRFVSLSSCRSRPWHTALGLNSPGSEGRGKRRAGLKSWGQEPGHWCTYGSSAVSCFEPFINCAAATAHGCVPPTALPPSPHRHRDSEAEALFASPVICRVTGMAGNVLTLAKSRLTGYILLIQRPTKSVTSVTGKNTSKRLELEHRRWLLTVLRSWKTLSTGVIWAMKVMSCLSK